MNIADLKRKIKFWQKKDMEGIIILDEAGQPVHHVVLKKVFLPVLIILVALLGFGIGRLAGEGNRGGVKIEYDAAVAGSSSSTNYVPTSRIIRTTSGSYAADSSKGAVFASSKGKKYYYTGCQNNISASNKVTFASASMAEAAGYTLASGCSSR